MLSLVLKKIFLVTFCLCTISASAQVSVALFPLKNKTDDKLLDWIGYSFPEIVFRKVSELSGIQAWDPVFLFGVDSLGWQLESDSIMMIHQNRWNWDFAIGGSYTATCDSVWITLKAAVMLRGNKITVKKKKVCGSTVNHLALCDGILSDLFTMLKYTISPQNAQLLRNATVKTGKSNVYATYAMGYGYEMRREINKAITAYSHVLAMDESFAPALSRLGTLYSQSRQRKEARDYLEKAAARLPGSSVAQAQLAEFLLYYDTPQKALSLINSQNELLEKTAAGMKVIGLAYLHTGEYQRAVSVLIRAVAAGSSDLETDFMLGRAYLSLGQFTTAAEIFGRLIKYRPFYTRYYSFLGEAYREAGRLMESADVLERAMTLDPDNVPNLINLANTYFTLGWYKKAEQYLLHAKDLNPDLQEIAINLGVIYWHMKRKNDAKEMFKHAAEDKINIQSAQNNEANILFLSGDIRQAIRAYKRADKYGKKSEVIVFNLALAYLSAGKIKKAVSRLDEVLLLSPNRLDVIIMQAQLASKEGLDENAELYYRKILDLSPGHREAMTRLVALLEKQERFEDAVKIVEAYLNDFPQDLEYRLLLPDIFRKMGWYEVAVAEYGNMLKDNDLKKSAKVYTGLGRCQFDIIRYKQGRNYEEVIYNLTKAIELDPTDPEPDLIIGSIYMEYKNYRSLAIEHWEKAYNKTTNSHERQKIKDLIAGEKQ